ncbi:hypothetical protein SynBIOSU31_02496 [Synechococcus sp. BIOS-U3-1]|nr:hypothetical protein SynBIOSU31_02496 [Synechococcus sp. BIOS-U3-1]
MGWSRISFKGIHWPIATLASIDKQLQTEWAFPRHGAGQ